MFAKILFCLLVIPLLLLARPVETFYGSIEVDEPVLLELIDSPAMQRLKHIRNYGVGYYLDYSEDYSRYEHSLGVFAILRIKGASLEEQIAGLLHDVSHTVFSHVGDWLFNCDNQEKGHQDHIHAEFLEKSGLAAILRKFHYDVPQILPLGSLYPALENTLPNLCADRIDYNIQGAYYQNQLSREEALEIVHDLTFQDNQWVSSRPDLMKKLARFSFFMTEACWGSAENYVSSRFLADALLRALELKLIAHDDLYVMTDQAMWDLLLNQTDPLIARKMQQIVSIKKQYECVDVHEADLVIKSKFRGIDPWIISENGIVRLSACDAEIAREYAACKQRMQQGFPIKYTHSEID